MVINDWCITDLSVAFLLTDFIQGRFFFYVSTIEITVRFKYKIRNKSVFPYKLIKALTIGFNRLTH